MGDIIKYNENEILSRAETIAENSIAGFNDNSIPVAQRDALWVHNTFVTLGKMGATVARNLRDIAAEMYTTKTYLNLRIPMENDPKEEIRFETFREWLNFAAQKAGLSDTLASTLNSYMESIVDPVSKGLLKKPDGTPYTVNEVIALREGHTQRLASGARQILKRNPDDFESVSEALDLATDEFTTAEDLGDYFRQKGVSSKRVAPAQCDVVHLADKSYYLIEIVSDDQEISVSAGLNNRVLYRSKTLEDVIEILRQDKVDSDTNSYSDYLNGVASNNDNSV